MKNIGECKLFFGRYAGWSFDAIQASNPSYLDWISGQSWLNPSTRNLVELFLSLPDVSAQVDEITDTDDDNRPNRVEAGRDGMSYDPRFNLGRRCWLKIERRYPSKKEHPERWHVPPVTPDEVDSWRYSSELPPFDWHPDQVQQQARRKDDQPRPRNLITAGASDSLSVLRRSGLTAEEIELASEPRQQIDSYRDAWQYAADMLAQIEGTFRPVEVVTSLNDDGSEVREMLLSVVSEPAESLTAEHVPLAFQPQAKQLANYLKPEVMARIRDAWNVRREQIKKNERRNLLPRHKIVSVRGLTPNDPSIVYCGRPCAGWNGSPLANPFKISEKQSRDQAIQNYERLLCSRLADNDEDVLNALREIKPDSVLGCWCAPLPCHCESISKVWHYLKSEALI